MGLISHIRRAFTREDHPALAEAEAKKLQLGFPEGAFFNITPDNALSVSTVFACVRRISETIGSLPCQLYRRCDTGGKEIALNHRLYYLLHQAPNADMTAYMFQEQITVDLCLYGNHFSEIYRNGAGQVTALYPLEPMRVSKARQHNSRNFVYRYTDYTGYREISEENILHVAGFRYDLGSGLSLSPIELARKSLEHACAVDEAATGLFKNGVAPSATLETDTILNSEQRHDIRDMMQEQAGLLRQPGGVIVLPHGFRYNPRPFKPVDAQILESRLYGVEEICTIFGVPPHMIGHTTKSTSWGSGLEQQNLWFVTYTIQPYLKRIETALTNKLLGPKDGGRHLMEYNLDGLLRADSTARAAYYSTAAQNGWMSRNEIRQKENLKPVPGGDDYTVQVNLTPIDQLGQSKTEGEA